MEYLPLGNLEEQNRESPIAVEEIMVLMYQGLSVLNYVHGHSVTHRDLKPGNFLVYSRSPFRVKLCDFGLAQDRSMLQTFCGSAIYLAPEVFNNSSYQSSVDVWSLAVILFEYVYGLPEKRKLPDPGGIQEWGLGWCQRLVAAAEDWDSDHLIDFLTEHMLKLDPRNRLPAGDCLTRASELGLFDVAFSKTGHVTPRLQPVPAAGEFDQEDQSTIMISRLWEDSSGGVLRQEENTAEPLNIFQSASLSKDAPIFDTSYISQIDRSNEGNLSNLSQTESATPRLSLQPNQGVENINTEDASTILGSLWQNVTASLRNEARVSRSRGRSELIPEEQGEPFYTRISSSENESAPALSPALAHIRCEQMEQLHPRMGSKVDQTPSSVSGQTCDNRSSKRRRTVSSFDQPYAQDQPPCESLKKAELPQTKVNTPPIRQTACFYMVDCGVGDIAIRKRDFKVNVTHVFHAAQKRDDKGRIIGIKDIPKQRKDIHFEVVRGSGMVMGSYTTFSKAIEICDLYDLPLITQSLLKVQSVYQQH